MIQILDQYELFTITEFDISDSYSSLSCVSKINKMPLGMFVSMGDIVKHT
jgi:hypothetical protein